jgi:hypothetical protein
MILANTRIIKEGIQIHKSSFLKTDQPHWLKKNWMLMGETLMGVQGKKYLSLERRMKKSAVAEKMVVGNTERKCDHVSIRNRRTKNSQRPEVMGNISRRKSNSAGGMMY